MKTYSLTFAKVGDETGWHDHKQTQKLHVETGSVTLILKLKAGDKILIPPHVRHAWTANEYTSISDVYE